MINKTIKIILFSFSSILLVKNSFAQQNETDYKQELREIRREAKARNADAGETNMDYSFLQDVAERQKQAENARAYHNPPAVQNKTGALPTSAFYDLRFFGPYNVAGRTRAVLPDKADSNLVFAGGTSGGLWRSTNYGQSWTPINDQTPGMNLTCITQNPFNPDIIYYGTGEHKNRKIESLGSGVYKSTDHGLTFSQLPSTNSPFFLLIHCVRHSITDSNTLYVSTQNSGVFKSTDGGASFQNVFNNFKAVNDIECFPDGKVMITSSFDGIYYSPTGNSGTFTKATSVLPTFGFGRIEIAYCDSFPSTVYSVFADSIQAPVSSLIGVYRSDDGGVTWTVVTNPNNVGYYPYPDFMLCLTVKPDNPDFLFCGGDKMAFSSDGGQSWTKLLYPRIDQHIVVFSKFNNNRFLLGNDQGVNSFDVSTIPAQQWLVNTYCISQIWAGSYFPQGNNFLIGIQDNVFQKNSNEDSMFVRIPTYGTDGNQTHVNQQDPNISYACGNFAEVFKSYNTMDSLPVYTHILNDLDTNGDDVVDDDVWHVNSLEMNYLDGNQLYLPTRDHIWRTINGGNNWISITNSSAGGVVHPFAVGISNDTFPTIYSGGSNGYFVRIDNAYTAVAGQEVDLSASVPVPVFQGGKITCMAVHPLDDAIVYATVDDKDSISKVYKIIDANTASPQWIDISSNLDKTNNIYWLEMDPLHPDSVLFIGTDYGLFSSLDGGTTWFRETDVPLITIYQMRLRRSDRKLFIYTMGRGIWIGRLDSNTDVQHFDAGTNGIKLFPNPTTGQFTLFAVADSNEPFSLSLNDLSGRTVLTKHAVAENGKLRLHLDIAKFANGIYFLSLTGNNKSRTLKIVKN